MTAKDINQSSPREPWLRNTKHAFSITRIHNSIFQSIESFTQKQFLDSFELNFFFKLNLAWWKIKTTRKYNRKGLKNLSPKIKKETGKTLGAERASEALVDLQSNHDFCLFRFPSLHRAYKRHRCFCIMYKLKCAKQKNWERRGNPPEKYITNRQGNVRGK